MTTVAEHKTLKSTGLHDEPLSFNHIKKWTALNSDLASFLKALANEDVYRRTWDFDGDAVIDDFWTFYEDATATGFTYPSTQELGGILQGATGTTADAGLGMLGQAVLKGDKRAYFHAHLSISAVTEFQCECGLVDAVTDKTLPVVTDVDTPAVGNGAVDVAVFHIDTDQTLDTAAFVVNGSTSGMADTKSNISTYTPTAATMFCVRIILDENDAYCVVDNKRSQRVSIGGNVEGGTLLAPWIYVRTRDTTGKTVKVDMVEVATER